MSAKFQLHPTALLDLSKCGELFRRKAIEQERVPRAVAAAIGTAVHTSSENDLRQKMTTGGLLPEEQVQDIARDAIVHEWEQVELRMEEEADGISSRDQAIDRSVLLARFHHETLAPKLNPTHLERDWVLDIDGLPIQMAGRIDVQEGAAAVRDLKNRGRAPSADEADRSLQLTAYSLAVRQHDYRFPDKVALDVQVITPKKNELRLVQLESRRSERDIAPLLERIAAAERAIRTGIFVPAPPDAWYCSSRWCPFFSVCRFSLKPVSISMAAAA